MHYDPHMRLPAAVAAKLVPGRPGPRLCPPAAGETRRDRSGPAGVRAAARRTARNLSGFARA